MSVFAGIGLDDVFILLSGLGDAPLRRADGSPTNTQERISFAMATSGVSITITSLTDFLAFGIGSSSSFVAIRNFSIYTGSLVDFSLSSQTSFISDWFFFLLAFFNFSFKICISEYEMLFWAIGFIRRFFFLLKKIYDTQS